MDSLYSNVWGIAIKPSGLLTQICVGFTFHTEMFWFSIFPVNDHKRLEQIAFKKLKPQLTEISHK